MSDQVINAQDETLNDIRNIVTTKVQTNKGVLNLTEKVEEENTPVNEQHNHVLQDISHALSTLSPDVKGKESIASVKTVIKKLKSRNETSKPEVNNTSLEGLVTALLEPKIQQWIDNNLSDIVRKVVTKEIKKIMTEE